MEFLNSLSNQLEKEFESLQLSDLLECLEVFARLRVSDENFLKLTREYVFQQTFLKRAALRIEKVAGPGKH